MVGDYECIKYMPYQTSIKCISKEGKVLVIKKEDFVKLNEVSGEYWKKIVQASHHVAEDNMKDYVDAMTKAVELRNFSNPDKKSDMKVICNDVMKEMIWSKPPGSLEMFTIKKHMKDVPKMKGKKISAFSQNDYEAIKTS